MSEIGHSYQDIYVAMCGQVFTTWPTGRSHERDCPTCQSEIRGLSASGPQRGDFERTTEPPLQRAQREFSHAFASAAEAIDCVDCAIPDRKCLNCGKCVHVHCRCADGEMRHALGETRELNRLDERDVAELTQAIDH